MDGDVRLSLSARRETTCTRGARCRPVCSEIHESEERFAARLGDKRRRFVIFGRRSCSVGVRRSSEGTPVAAAWITIEVTARAIVVQSAADSPRQGRGDPPPCRTISTSLVTLPLKQPDNGSA